MDINEMLFSSDIKDKLKAIEYIAENKLNEYAKDLFKMLKYENDTIIQEAIISTLKQLDLEKVPNEVFLELLQSEKLLLKEFALSLLSISKKLDVLGNLINSEDKDVRKYALDALYRTKDKEAIKYIAKCLDDKDINNKIAAIEYLGLMGANEYAEKIAQILKNTNNPFLITTILESLSIIGDEKSDTIIKEKFKEIKSPHFIIPYAKYIFNKKDVFRSVEFFEKCEYKHLVIKEFLDYLHKNNKKIKLYAKLKKRVISILKDLLKNKLYHMYTNDILILINLFTEDGIEELLKEHIEILNEEGIMAAVEIINERKLKSFKDILQKIKDNYSEETRMIIEETLMEMERW
ncbi:HEAT repeat domain-containing protein [Marinitoga litoralis]|uniref:HEAT repeat domain-containing protein n=1 Tax=Marinitoga litoralis TaxID=570855 RepID=UPI001960C4E2|nr:HEAT repeat domain-containing protein [Marinitoga litoralis]MBM7558578.1 HEAT repeat protein [Marinitoga litoralis]